MNGVDFSDDFSDVQDHKPISTIAGIDDPKDQQHDPHDEQDE
jgi:hypothetical protein